MNNKYAIVSGNTAICLYVNPDGSYCGFEGLDPVFIKRHYEKTHRYNGALNEIRLQDINLSQLKDQRTVAQIQDYCSDPQLREDCRKATARQMKKPYTPLLSSLAASYSKRKAKVSSSARPFSSSSSATAASYSKRRAKVSSSARPFSSSSSATAVIGRSRARSRSRTRTPFQLPSQPSSSSSPSPSRFRSPSPPPLFAASSRSPSPIPPRPSLLFASSSRQPSPSRSGEEFLTPDPFDLSLQPLIKSRESSPSRSPSPSRFGGYQYYTSLWYMHCF